jgi:four helix bundle protein
MAYKFQELEVYQLSLDYLDQLYELGRRLPESEKFNLKNQLERSATSIVLNIAEGSTGLSNVEQKRFLAMASRSYLETVACLDILVRRKYVQEQQLQPIWDLGHRLSVKLQAFLKALKS